ncbi:hypothetical protein [Leucobacter massiliensis]|uniref:Uncharacterized protein n=1 Tax=Leucobacter massiliensis TaxID=1686285 RepID=A0A2S9QMA1_9MICO|nr:hypothetical protein [Leucobacter massiliensis]PRI10722.1 hypothetical protein B4915_07420 [Leucobacter massiliensis]
MGRRIAAWAVGAVLTALYASTVVAAVGNFVLLPQLAAQLGLGMSPLGWFWLSFGVLMPVAVFAIALVIGRRRTAGLRILVLAAGLGVVAAWQLEVMHLVPQFSYFAS